MRPTNTIKAGKTPRTAGARVPKPVRIPTIDAGWVEWAVSEHVARYSSPRGRIEQLLRARVRKAEHKGAVIPSDIAAVIAAVLDKHVGHGTIDDAAWAESRARTLTRRGVPGSVVRQRLREKGIRDTAPAMAAMDEEIGVEGSVGVDGEEDVEPTSVDLVAGCAYARRKRVGPFSRSEDPKADRQKSLGAMARAGFSFDVAKKVLAMERDAAETLLERMP